MNKLSTLTGDKEIKLVIAGNPAEMKQIDKYLHSSENILTSEEINTSVNFYRKIKS